MGGGRLCLILSVWLNLHFFSPLYVDVIKWSAELNEMSHPLHLNHCHVGQKPSHVVPPLRGVFPTAWVGRYQFPRSSKLLTMPAPAERSITVVTAMDPPTAGAAVGGPAAVAIRISNSPTARGYTHCHGRWEPLHVHCRRRAWSKTCGNHNGMR